MCAYVYIYIYIYIHTHTHTHTYTRMKYTAQVKKLVGMYCEWVYMCVYVYIYIYTLLKKPTAEKIGRDEL